MADYTELKSVIESQINASKELILGHLKDSPSFQAHSAEWLKFAKENSEIADPTYGDFLLRDLIDNSTMLGSVGGGTVVIEQGE